MQEPISVEAFEQNLKFEQEELRVKKAILWAEVNIHIHEANRLKKIQYDLSVAIEQQMHLVQDKTNRAQQHAERIDEISYLFMQDNKNQD